jgi:hypothetical protein
MPARGITRRADIIASITDMADYPNARWVKSVPT